MLCSLMKCCNAIDSMPYTRIKMRRIQIVMQQEKQLFFQIELRRRMMMILRHEAIFPLVVPSSSLAWISCSAPLLLPVPETRFICRWGSATTRLTTLWYSNNNTMDTIERSSLNYPYEPLPAPQVFRLIFLRILLNLVSFLPFPPFLTLHHLLPFLMQLLQVICTHRIMPIHIMFIPAGNSMRRQVSLSSRLRGLLSMFGKRFRANQSRTWIDFGCLKNRLVHMTSHPSDVAISPDVTCHASDPHEKMITSSPLSYYYYFQLMYSSWHVSVSSSVSAGIPLLLLSSSRRLLEMLRVWILIQFHVWWDKTMTRVTGILFYFLTAQIGHPVYLHCLVEPIGDKMVREITFCHLMYHYHHQLQHHPHDAAHISSLPSFSFIPVETTRSTHLRLFLFGSFCLLFLMPPLTIIILPSKHCDTINGEDEVWFILWRVSESSALISCYSLWLLFSENVMLTWFTQISPILLLHITSSSWLLHPQVSWLRMTSMKDFHLLTVGLFTYTSDDRFVIRHGTLQPNDWALQIKHVTPSDEGIYECQVSQNKESG